MRILARTRFFAFDSSMGPRSCISVDVFGRSSIEYVLGSVPNASISLTSRPTLSSLVECFRVLVVVLKLRDLAIVALCIQLVAAGRLGDMVGSEPAA